MPEEKYSRDQIVAIGEAIYDREIRPRLNEADRGKYVVLDIQTGEYEIDADDLTATKRAFERRPDAVLYGLRVGYPAAYRLGGFSRVHP